VAEIEEQLIDPQVSRLKFDRETEALREHQWGHHRRGWLVMDTNYPKVFVIFATPDLHPVAVLFGVELDFSNYDLWPPSVTLVDPFTREPYTNKTLPAGLGFPRLTEDEPPKLQNLLQPSEDPEGKPFICIPGTREYHQHPYHTGDSWLLHRGRGEGTLFFLLNKLYEHGVQPLSGWKVHIGTPAFDSGRIPR
jgi:hypothetical protein